MRVLIAGTGVLVLGYGVFLMLRWQTVSQVAEVVGWAAAGVVIHDGVLAPLAVGVGWFVRTRLPRRAAGPVAVGLLLLGTLTITGFAVLTRSHGGGANHTLLDRDYPAGLAVAAAAIAIGVMLVLTIRAERWRRWRRGPSDGGR